MHTNENTWIEMCAFGVRTFDRMCVCVSVPWCLYEFVYSMRFPASILHRPYAVQKCLMADCQMSSVFLREILP